MVSAASDGPSSLSASGSAASNTKSLAPQISRLQPAEAQALRSAVAQARELAAKAQRKAEEKKQPETQTQEWWENPQDKEKHSHFALCKSF